jgi:hypothetical protein
MHILLDLNYTLVSNSLEKLTPFTRQIEHERYRGDLIAALLEVPVILITARPDVHRRQTLRSIQEKTGWSPDEAFFNDTKYFPPAFKKSVLDRFLKDRGLEFFGIESNPKTRAMYANQGIKSVPYETFIQDPKQWLNPP